MQSLSLVFSPLLCYSCLFSLVYLSAMKNTLKNTVSRDWHFDKFEFSSVRFSRSARAYDQSWKTIIFCDYESPCSKPNRREGKTFCQRKTWIPRENFIISSSRWRISDLEYCNFFSNHVMAGKTRIPFHKRIKVKVVQNFTKKNLAVCNQSDKNNQT